MTAKPIHIFKAGTHITTAGESITFSQADIEATAKAYNPVLHKAPLVKGHPRSDDPAQGWAKSLQTNASGLFALPMQVDVAFAEDVNAGRFGTVSAKFYRPDEAANPVPGVWYLRHIGFLGAQPPAIKGLNSPEFSEADAGADDGCVCFQEGIAFSEWGDQINAGIWRQFREWLIGKFGLEEANKALPGWDVATLERDAHQSSIEAPPAFSESPPNQGETMSDADKQRLVQLEAENKRLKDEQAAAKAVARHQTNVEFAEKLIGEGRLAPVARDVLVATLDLADQPQGADAKAVQFGEGDAAQPLGEALRALFSGAGKVIEFGEHATKDKATNPDTGAAASAEFAEKSTDPDRLSLHVRATQLASDKSIPYELAVRQLIS